MRSFIFLIASLFLFVPFLHAQDNAITVSAQGEIELPADIIQFNITLNAEAETPQKAYELHKKREKVLVRLLDKYRIDEEHIRFQPLSISRDYSDEYTQTGERERKEIYRTNQHVSLKLDDFEAYEKIQVTLIENNFDNFSGNFLSSEQKQGEDDALRQAIEEARSKAEIIARESNVQLGSIKQITYSQTQFIPSGQLEQVAFRSADQSLLRFEQTVTVRASVTIEFYFNQ